MVAKIIDSKTIQLIDMTQFNIEHILKCGQVFRFEQKDLLEGFEKGSDVWSVISGNQVACVSGSVIKCTDAKYFYNYFNFDIDYSKIKKAVVVNSSLAAAVEFGWGIRILKQDFVETIISFIISANNHISRIQSSLNKISKNFGTKIKNDVFAFPTIKQLAKIDELDFMEFGCGYRSGQLVKAIKQLQEIKEENFAKLTNEELTKALMTISGVGPKVASCISLFWANRYNSFPVDTHILKMYNKYFDNCKNRIIIEERLKHLFGENSGFAQQYLFYYERSGNK